MANNTASTIISRVWNYAHVLRDDGIGYGDYVEQITYLLFLKMAQERKDEGRATSIPEEWSWNRLRGLEGSDLETHYFDTLKELAKEKGLLGAIYRKAQNKIQDPAKLQRLIYLIDRENWSELDADVKGEIYEGLLERNAQDVKGGAGQYFTPRPLIRAIVEVMQPRLGMIIADPACGTGGFLLVAHEYMAKQQPDKKQARFLKEKALRGVDIVDGVVRLCTMNLYLHGVGGNEPIACRDSLLEEPAEKVDMVLTNPPFGKKSSITLMEMDEEKTENGKVKKSNLIYERANFVTTSNKQLNFVQHVVSMLKINGRAAVVVPDNVLFEGGAGEKIRRQLLKSCDVHTLLRLPTGIFYAQGVKANVLFFDRKPASEAAWTQQLWIYDLRTNTRFTLKQNTLRDEALKDFVRCFQATDRSQRIESERFRAFSYEELIKRDKANLDIFWLREEGLNDSQALPAPQVLAAEIIEQLEAALEEFRSIEEALVEQEASQS